MPPRHTLTRADVIKAARAIVESEGVGNLSMRKLSATLGTAVTSIYWHIGNRDALLDALIEEETNEWKQIKPTGGTPHARVVSVARVLRERLLTGRNIIELVAERGMIFDIFIPTYEVLAGEFLAAGLGEERAAMAVRTVQFHVVGSVILQRRAERHPGHPVGPVTSPGISDQEVAAVRVTSAALAIPAEDAFEAATALLAEGLLRPEG